MERKPKHKLVKISGEHFTFTLVLFASLCSRRLFPIVSEYRNRVTSHQFLALRVIPQKMGNFHPVQTVLVQPVQ